MNAKEIRSQKVLTDEMLKELVSLVHPLFIEKVGSGSLKVVQITDMSGLQTSHYMMMDLITEDNKEAISNLPADTFVPVGPVYTIGYTSTEGAIPESRAVRSMADKKYTLTESDLPTIVGKTSTFGGWSLNGKKVVAGDIIEGNVTLTAIWVSPITISYEVNPSDLEVVGLPENGEVNPEADGTYELTAVDLPSEVVAEGYGLEGYYINDEKVVVGDKISGTSVVITAKFIKE